MSRKLATFRIVTDLLPIDGADQIEVAQVDSWKVVVRKGEVTVGSLVVYFEIDSWIPHSLAPFLSRGNPPKKFEEIEGEKLRTIRLKGQISQGLIMNVSDIIKIIPDFEEKAKEAGGIVEGTDLTDVLNIKKWELPSSMGTDLTDVLNIKKWELPSSMGGTFPSFVPKTDQERIQNLTKQFNNIKKVRWEVTEKYDGSSLTVYYYKHGRDGETEVKEGVCSRNLDLKMEAKDGVINAYWEIALREKLLDKLREVNAQEGKNLALQGEMVGVKICTNIYKLTSRDFWLFDIYDIDNGRYYTPNERQDFAKKYDIKHVPVLLNDYEIPEDSTIHSLLKFSEGKSHLNPKIEREGLVFKKMNTVKEPCNVNSFKIVSNKFLMKSEN